MHITEQSAGYPDAKVCKVKGCVNVFAVGEGAARTDKLYCSNACRQKAYRQGGPVAKGMKLEEIAYRQRELARAILDKMDEVRLMGKDSDALCHAAGVARGEDWSDAWEEIALLQNAMKERGDYEGF